MIILQTAVMPRILILKGFYDLLIPFVIYLGIFCPVRESLPVICFLGGIMDNLSGGPFGLYLIAYLWVFLGTKWGASFLHVGNLILFPFVAVLGVLAENFLFFAALGISGSSLPPDAFEIVAGQVLWAFATGAFVLLFLIHIQKKLDLWISRRFAKREA